MTTSAVFMRKAGNQHTEVLSRKLMWMSEAWPKVEEHAVSRVYGFLNVVFIAPKEVAPTMIIPMSIDYAAQISGWTYENEYSIYSFHQDDDTVKELMNGEYYACLDQFNNLSGYFCFGKSAQIPTIEKSVYTPEMLDIGLGMKPALCGKGYGYSFVKSGLDFAQSNFHVKQIRLTVAAFNTRAIRIYEKIGFGLLSRVTHSKTQNTFQVMEYMY